MLTRFCRVFLSEQTEMRVKLKCVKETYTGRAVFHTVFVLLCCFTSTKGAVLNGKLICCCSPCKAEWGWLHVVNVCVQSKPTCLLLCSSSCLLRYSWLNIILHCGSSEVSDTPFHTAQMPASLLHIAFRDEIRKVYYSLRRLCVEVHLKDANQKSIGYSRSSQLLYTTSRHCGLLKCV